jgi:hypothetical protein
MAKYRKKPVVIEAVPVDEAIRCAESPHLDGWLALPEWLRDANDRGDVVFMPDHVMIHTLEGRMRGERTDWIIQGVQGEIYPCKDSIFQMTYEAVTDG